MVYSCCGTHLRHDIPSGQKSLEMFTRAEEPFLPWKMLLTDTLLDFNMSYTSFSTTPVSILERMYGMLRRRLFAAMNGPDGWTYSSLCGGCAESWLASFVVEAECCCERSFCLEGWTRVGCCFGVFGHSSVLQKLSSVYPACLF